MVVRQTKRRQYFVERFVWQSQTEEKTTHNSVRVLRGRVTDEKKKKKDSVEHLMWRGRDSKRRGQRTQDSVESFVW